MTTARNAKPDRVRAQAPRTQAPTREVSPTELAGETQSAVLSRLRQIAGEVEALQGEIAAVEAFVTDPSTSGTLSAVRPGAGWTPTPTPQPWLEARSA